MPTSDADGRPALLDRLARLAVSALGASAAVLVDAEGGAPRVCAAAGSGAADTVAGLDPASALVARVLAGGTVAWSGGEPSAEAGWPGAGAVLGVPIAGAEGASLGALVVANAGPRAWTADDVRAAEDVAAAAGAALELAGRDRRERRLRDSVRVLEKAVETMQLGVTVTGLDGAIVYTNPAEAAMHGYEVHELVGRPSRVFAPRDRWQEHRRPPIGTLRRWSRESENVRRDGSRFPVALWSDAVFDDAGQPLGVVTCSADLTETREREAALLRREREFQTLAENAPDVVARVDRGLRITYLNAAGARALGQPVEALLGRVLGGERPDGGEGWGPLPGAEAVRQVMATGAECSVEVVAVAPDGGEPRVFEARLVPERDAAGALETVLAISRDVSAARRAERALRESEARYRSVVDSVQEVVFRTDREGRWTLLNPAWTEILGYTVEESLGRHFAEFVAPEAREEEMRRFRSAMEEGHIPHRRVQPFVARDGRVRCLAGTLRVMRGPGGQALGGQGALDDVTERHLAEQALADSERRYRLLFEKAPVAIMTAGPDGRLQQVNPAAEALLGHPAAVLVGSRAADFTHPDDAAAQRAAVAEVLAGRRTEAVLEKRYVRAGGDAVWAQSTLTALRGEDGELLGMLSMSQDVTPLRETVRALQAAHDEMEARVRARTAELDAANASLRAQVEQRTRSEQALRESEARFRAVVENVGEALLLSDAEGTILYANPQVRKVTGHHPRELDGASLCALLGTAGQPPVPPGTRRRLQITRKDGSAGWVDAVSSPLYGAEGRLAAVLTAVADVTERTLADRELQAVQQRLRLLVETVRDYSMVVLDTEGYVVSWNAGAERNTGYPAEEILGQHVSLFFPPEQLAEGRPASDLRKAEQRGHHPWEGWRLRRGGSRYWANTVLTALRDEGGRLVGFAEITRDLTDRREAEEALRRSEEQLRHSQKMEAVGRLAGGIAHDFNNILMAVGGHVQLLLRRTGADDPARRSLEEVKKGADRAAALTRQLLAFSRRQVLQTRVLELGRVVADMEGMLQPLIGADVELVLRLDAGGARVRADVSQMEQVVMNLVVNARDAMPDGGVVVIETSRVELGGGGPAAHALAAPGEYVRLAVTDSGHGMDEATRQQVFEPFFTTKPAGKGTGLGLSTVYGIVRQSGGHVTVESTEGIATTFSVYLPAEAGEEPSRPAEAPAAAGAGGGETVLLVEDEPAVRALLAQVLGEAGYRVLQAMGGAEALALAARHADPIHLLLTDVVMPGMNGGELARRIRTLRPAVRVLFVSGYAAEDVARMGLEAGGAELLQKPVLPDEVTARVRAALDRAAEEA